jgi:cardiolipin synthase
LHREATTPGALLRIEGPSVAELQWLFVEDWKQRLQRPLRAGRYFPALAWVGSHRVGVAPAGSQSSPSPLVRALIAAVDAAQDRALLVCRDGLPPKPLERALAAACIRGVDVHLLLASGAQGWLQRQSARAQAMQLVRSGMHVHELKDARPRGTGSVIDGVWSSVAVGPAGLPVREQDHLIVLDAQFGALTEEDFWGDAEHCDEPFADPWTRPSAFQRLNLRLARYLEVSL